MPAPIDYASMWWVEGFPDVITGAPWERVIQTGSYAFVLNSETLEVPHFGSLDGTKGATNRSPAESAPWKQLPPATITLQIDVNGKSYRNQGGAVWDRFDGPRLVESGRFFQRGDVTGLSFVSDDGEVLNTKARFETAAWPDQLSLLLYAEPGERDIDKGENSFGFIKGGFGLDGSNAMTIPHTPKFDTPEFTLEFRAFIPKNYRVSDSVWPWLLCKSLNEYVDGHYGIRVVNGRAEAHFNVGGGRENLVTTESSEIKSNEWNHFAISYDGDVLRFYVNGKGIDEKKMGQPRTSHPSPMVFGRRGDNHGDGYPFRGVVDEIRYYDKALAGAEVIQRFHNPASDYGAVVVKEFREDGKSSLTRLKDRWENPLLKVSLSTEGTNREAVRAGNRVALLLEPGKEKVSTEAPVSVTAQGSEVVFDSDYGWYRIDLDGLEKKIPEGRGPNDAMEMLAFTISNETQESKMARLLFAKTRVGLRHSIGSPITGMSAILRDSDGNPTGIPVQLSKNWHYHKSRGAYADVWFHGLSQLRMPPKAKLDLELVIVYGHWGGVAAASHAQLSLIGWGSNQRWDQSALGSWGESICYEASQAQAGCLVTDVRPLMVASKNDGKPWGWTNNVGGADFFRFFDPDGVRVGFGSMNARYLRYGPCLTEVEYSGVIGGAMRHSITTSLSRTDDIVRATYQIRLDVDEQRDFSRFALFQVGSDQYNMSRHKKFALGNENGLAREWVPRNDQEGQRALPDSVNGRVFWASLHEAAPRAGQEGPGAWVNRGFLIREWNARLGGKAASPRFAEFKTGKRAGNTVILEVVPPSGITRILPGDFVEATIEHVVIPQKPGDYYGPNEALRTALKEMAGSWKMIHREAIGNSREINLQEGVLLHRYPDVRVVTSGERASYTLSGGIGYVPLTFAGCKKSSGYVLTVNGKVVDQSVHGSDFWQTDYDASTQKWSHTFNIPVEDTNTRTIEFFPTP